MLRLLLAFVCALSYGAELRGPLAPPTLPVLPALVLPVVAVPAGTLWTGGAPASDTRRLMRAAHWETTKFFFTSRVVLLRDMIDQQKLATRGLERSVADLEAMWLDWRTQAFSGRVTTAGFEPADRVTIRRAALKIFRSRYPRDAAARAAFDLYLERVDAHVPLARPSQYRKLAFGVIFENPTTPPDRLIEKINAKLSQDYLAAVDEFRTKRQPALYAAFSNAAQHAQQDVNLTLPDGKKIVAAIVLGSYAIDQATPSSDIDYALVTQDGGLAAVAPFKDALDRRWTVDRIDKIEAFQFTLPPSPEVLRGSFLEGYRVVSADPAAVAALSHSDFNPSAPSRWTRFRGIAFGAFYRAWCWAFLRWSSVTLS